MRILLNFVTEMDIVENIKNAVLNTTLWEWLAVSSGLFYVVLISYKKTAAWFFAVVSSTLYIYLCYINQLYLETGLQFFYLLMGLYGWYMWSSDDTDEEQAIIRWKTSYHLINIFVSGVLAVTLGFIFANFTNQANPYTDAFTTVFSLAATFMVTQRVLENWIYWIVIDAASIYLFSSREMYMTSVLFVLYTLIAIFGYLKWKKIYFTEQD